MSIFDTSLTDHPVDNKDFQSYNIEDLPKLILGFEIKNKYDQKRLTFKKLYQPKNILHFINRSDDLEPI